MKRTIVLVIFLSFLIWGCFSDLDETSIRTFTAAPPTPNAAATLQTNTPPATYRENIPETTATATLESGEPLTKDQLPISKICSGNIDVSFPDLEIDPSLRLLVVSLNERWVVENGVFSLAGRSPSPERIPDTVPPEDEIYEGFRVSPDGAWLINYRRFDGGEKRELWIRRIDGTEERQVITVGPKEKAGWVSSHDLIIYGEVGDYYGDWRDEIPIMHIDPIKGEEQFLSPLSEGAILFDYFTLEDVPHALYYKGLNPFEEIGLYDYGSNTSIPVYSWLVRNEEINYHTTSVRFIDGVFVASVHRYYGIDISSGLNLEEIQEKTSYAEVMVSLQFPGEDSLRRSTRFSDEFNDGLYLIQSFDDKPAAPVYVLDINNLVLLDYCLPILDTGSTWHISPDERFIAFTNVPLAPDVNNGLFPNQDDTVIVLDLKTGNRAYLDGLRVLGWGVMP